MTPQYESLLKELNEKIWDASELKFDEFKSADAITALLKEQGFTVSTNLAGMETAFTARFGSGQPVIGFLAEYDALSGLSQQAEVASPTPRPETQNGHGCGHNLLGTGAVGAALLLKDYLVSSKKQGTVVLLGCPAEEGGSGKAYLAREGVFDGLDVALTWHPSGGHCVMSGSMQANCQVYFRFKGTSSHAASAPHLGRSALDAVELMNVGVNYMREHMQSDDRVHYAVTDTGGISPNVVQNHAEVIYLIRSVDNDRVKGLYERVCKIAKAAAMMTETEVEILFDKACSNILPNEVLEQVLYQSMQDIPLPKLSEEDIAFAKKIKPLIREADLKGDLSLQGQPRKVQEAALAHYRDCVVSDMVVPYQHSETCIAGSSDVGDCSHAVPTAQFAGGCYVPGTPLHSWIAVAQGKSASAVKIMYYAAEVLADAGQKIINDPSIATKAKAEYHERTEGKGYQCPIPADIKPNALGKQGG